MSGVISPTTAATSLSHYIQLRPVAWNILKSMVAAGDTKEKMTALLVHTDNDVVSVVDCSKVALATHSKDPKAVATVLSMLQNREVEKGQQIIMMCDQKGGMTITRVSMLFNAAAEGVKQDAAMTREQYDEMRNKEEEKKQ